VAHIARPDNAKAALEEIEAAADAALERLARDARAEAG
jgi:hypothetical protein